MKLKFLMISLLGLVSISAFAQKGELNNAQEQYDKFTGLNVNKAMAALAKTSLVSAKTSIDKAAVNAKTSALPQTAALQGAIYSALAYQDTVAATSAVEYTTAAEALKKAKELDTKGEYKALIEAGNRNLAQFQLNKGVTEFQAKRYDEAYKAFDAARVIIPDDTTTVLNTSIAAVNAKNYPAAIANYNKLLTLNYSEKYRIYTDLPTLYLIQKDTANAIRVIGEGIAKYPTNTDLRKREIEVSLQSGKQNDLVTKIDAAIKNDPKNKTLYYYAGLTYSVIAENASAGLDKAKDDASKKAFEKSKADAYAKAVENYKKAIEIDPSYFDANLNLGYVLIRPAIDTYNAAVKLPASKQKEYDAGIAKASLQFDDAKPFLLKAYELNPKSPDALTNLLSYYRGKKDNANAAKIKAELDAVKGN